MRFFQVILVLSIACYTTCLNESYAQAISEVKANLSDLTTIPLRTNADALVLKACFRLLRIITVEIGTGEFSFAAILMVIWNDFRVQHLWNDPSGNVSRIRTKCDNIWCPDIRLFNTIGSINDESDVTSNIIVQRNGNITLSEPRLYTIACSLDAYLFPFDTQMCNLEFGSWTYMQNEIEFESHVLPTLERASNGWNVEEPVSEQAETNILLYPQKLFIFTITLRRQWKPYFLNIVAPTVLISVLSLLIFFLPVQSGGKVDFGVTIFLTLCVNSLVIAEAVPATSQKVPLITWVNSVVTGMVAGSLLVAIFTTRFLQESGKAPPIPKYLHIFLYYVGFVFCIGFRKWTKKSDVEISSENGSDIYLTQMPKSDNNMDAIGEDIKTIRRIMEGNEESSANFNVCDKPNNYSN